MTYALSQPLQAAIYHRLAADGALQALVQGAVFDQLPPGEEPPLYVALGPEVARDRSDQTTRAAEHDVTLSVVSDGAGFTPAKAAAGALVDALLDAPLPLARGRLCWMMFRSARARRRGTGEGRQIDLTFRARVEDDAA